MRRFPVPARRAIAVCIVIAIHFLIGRALYGAFAARQPLPLPDVAEAIQVRLINVPPPVRQAPDPASPSPPPSQQAEPDSPSAFIAAGAARAGEALPARAPAVPVVESAFFDTRALADACARSYPDAAPDLDIEGTLLLMIKVEPSGRPSELKIIKPSGAPSLDEAVGACVMSLGTFDPASVDGRLVSSWRRLQWTHVHSAAASQN